MKDEIYKYASIFLQKSFYIIGGMVKSEATSTIARLNTDSWKWSSAGNLNKARFDHGAIFQGTKLIVIGGPENKPTEFCTLEQGNN